MKLQSKLIVASLLSLAVTGSAFAADLAVKAPVAPMAGCAWCGFYVGDNIGYAWGRSNENSVFTAPAPFDPLDSAALSAAGSPRLKANGVTGGAQAGYNWQTGAAVYGLEADFNAFDLRGNTGGSFVFPSTLPGGSAGAATPIFFPAATTVSSDWLFTGRGRIGWADNSWLLYGTGGVAVGNVKVNQTIGLLAPFVETATVSSTQVGWTVGAGFEYMVARNWSVKGEYLYVDLGKVNATGTLTPAFAGITYTTTAHVTANIARVGVNYHFGGPVVAKY